MKKKLSTRLSINIAILVIAFMAAIIAIAVLMSSNFVSEGSSGQFSAYAKQNAIQIGAMLSEAENAAEGLRSSVTATYTDSNTSSDETSDSVVYGQKVNAKCKQIENDAISTGWSAVSSSESLIGLGVFFEPYALDKGIEKYAVYIDKSMAQSKTVSMYTEDYLTAAYYKSAVESNQIVITDPFMYKDIYMVSVAYPISVNDKVVGAVIADISMNSFSGIRTTDTVYKSMYAGIFKDNGIVMYLSNNNDAIGKNFDTLYTNSSDAANITKKISEGKSFNINTINSAGKKEVNYFEPVNLGSATWWSQTSVTAKDLSSKSTQLAIILIIIAIVSIAIIVVFTSMIIKKSLLPVQDIVVAAKRIENGDLDINLDVKSEDEIGQLALSFNNMSNRLRTIIEDISYIVTEIANNNLQANSNHEDLYIGEYSKISIALVNINKKLALANEQLKTLTLLDELTGLPNRRCFREFVEKMFQCNETDLTLSVIMIDVDNFKQYNDLYGHEKGDLALIAIANQINALPEDTEQIAVRWGGEEFIYAAFNKSREDIIEIANTIRLNILGLQIPSRNSITNPYITVSLGTCTAIISSQRDIGKIIDTADKAMYLAKGNGRNCVATLSYNESSSRNGL